MWGKWCSMVGCQVQMEIQYCCWKSHLWKDPAKHSDMSPTSLSKSNILLLLNFIVAIRVDGSQIT